MAKKPTIVEPGSKTRLSIKDAAKGITKKPSGMEKLVQDVTNRYRVTAREARDIVTAVSTAADVFSTQKPKNQAAANKNVVKQVKETVKAATTGQKGTTSAKAKFTKGENIVVPGKKRK